jgi:hypothetical protein
LENNFLCYIVPEFRNAASLEKALTLAVAAAKDAGFSKLIGLTTTDDHDLASAVVSAGGSFGDERELPDGSYRTFRLG